MVVAYAVIYLAYGLERVFEAFLYISTPLPMHVQRPPGRGEEVV